MKHTKEVKAGIERITLNGASLPWASVVELMDDAKREQVHAELAPCSNEEFLARYLELDPEFSVN